MLSSFDWPLGEHWDTGYQINNPFAMESAVAKSFIVRDFMALRDTYDINITFPSL